MVFISFTTKMFLLQFNASIIHLKEIIFFENTMYNSTTLALRIVLDINYNLGRSNCFHLFLNFGTWCDSQIFMPRWCKRTDINNFISSLCVLLSQHFFNGFRLSEKLLTPDADRVRKTVTDYWLFFLLFFSLRTLLVQVAESPVVRGRKYCLEVRIILALSEMQRSFYFLGHE